MKTKINQIVVLLFVLAMFFIMSISAHAETERRYFFNSASSLSNIQLDGVTIKPQRTSLSTKAKARTIFNENVTHYVKVCSGDNTATDFTIETQSKGVLLVYYARTWGENTIINDTNDLRINNLDGVAEIYDKDKVLGYGVKYFVLTENTTYTMTATDLCGVYGFVYMPGNVAAYDVKGDVSMMGQYCLNSYENLPTQEKEKWHFNGWYKDQARTVILNEKGAITEPTIIFASWTRYVWDFNEYSGVTINYSNLSLDYDGILIKGSEKNDDSYTYISADYCLNLFSTSTTDKNCIVFTPEYDGEMTVTYASTRSGVNRICAIGTDVVGNANALNNNPSVVAYGANNSTMEWKTLQAKMKAGVTYYIFNVNGGIKIDKIRYQASAASAVMDGDNVSLTVAANMQGWRPFYDADNSYTVDNNTNVYMVVDKENGEDAVKLANRTGKKVPKGCPVILHSDAVQEDGTYLITMTKDATPYEYEGNDNLLSASVTGTPVNAYRLGYRAGEGNGVAFYSWSADTPTAGIVYLDLSDINTAKIALEIEDIATGVVSIRNKYNEDGYIFNINGQRLNVPQKGFNIINGKKVIVL